MKPDGDTTTPAEPADVVEPAPEAATNEEQVQQDLSPSSPQGEKPENESGQEGANATLPPPGEEVDGKFSKPKDKTKAPVKPKFGTAGTKMTTATGATSRPVTAQSRAANGVKAASNGACKKPVNMTAAITKKSAPVRASAQVKKVPTATTVPPRMQVKAGEKKAAGPARPVPSTGSGTGKKAAVATSTTLNKKPVTAGSNAPLKPRSTGTALQKLP